jgi:hypothetical protein
MSASVGPISRRRVLQGAAWTAPAILIATAVPAAAASGATGTGSFVRITNVALTNQNGLRNAGFNFTYHYSVYNDTAPLLAAKIEPSVAAANSAFTSWATTWLVDVLNSSGAVVYTASGSKVLSHDKGFLQPDVIITVPTVGIYTVRLTVTSGQVASISGATFGLNTVVLTSASVEIT